MAANAVVERKSIGKRVDGWGNRDLNIGAIVALAPTLNPFTDLLGVNDVAVNFLTSWGRC